MWVLMGFFPVLFHSQLCFASFTLTSFIRIENVLVSVMFPYKDAIYTVLTCKITGRNRK